MSGYMYENEKKWVFTDEGQKQFLAIRDKAKYLLKEAGAFREVELLRGFSGGSWEMLACVDRLVELGELAVLREKCWRQYRVYATSEVGER